VKKSPYLNDDGTFKGGFDGCVLHMTNIEGHSEESAKKICGKIAQQVMHGRSRESGVRSQESDCLPLHARTLATEINALGEMMYVPGGDHFITCGMGDAIAQVTIRVDATTAAVLQASLAKVNSENSPQRALFDKEHEGKEAMAWPVSFAWRESPTPGVYAKAEWSALGEQLVGGKALRAFSGSFYSDADLPKRNAVRAGQTYRVPEGKRGSAANPARMTGLDFPYAGTLTNNPAFRKILPLWAKNAAGAHSSKTNQKQMNKKTPEELAALRARKTELEQLIPTLKAKDQADAANAEAVQTAESELDTVTAQLDGAALQARNEELEQAVITQRTKDADTAVQAAVKRGAIPAKNEALQAKWKQRCVQDPENIELLASMKGSPALESPRFTLGSVRIEREDIHMVLRAYDQEHNPRKKGMIYAADLSERIKKGEQLPLHASNTPGTLSGAIVTQRTLELLTLEQPSIAALATDFSDESAVLNQQITTRIVGIPGTTAYNTTTGYATENTVMTDVPVTIDSHKSCQVAFGAEELAGTSRRLFDELAPAMAYALGKDIIDDALANITAANFTNAPTVQALIDFNRATVIAAGGALGDRGVPTSNRTLLLTGSYYDKLFSDDTIVLLAANQRQDLVTGSRMIPLHDFNVMRAPTLPATNNLVGFGFHKCALVVAARVPSDYASALPGATGGGTSQVIMNPQSGLSVHLVQFVDHLLGKAFVRLAFMFGSAKGQINAGQRLTSS
jgi:hypothetical protein